MVDACISTCYLSVCLPIRLSDLEFLVQQVTNHTLFITFHRDHETPSKPKNRRNHVTMPYLPRLFRPHAPPPLSGTATGPFPFPFPYAWPPLPAAPPRPSPVMCRTGEVTPACPAGPEPELELAPEAGVGVERFMIVGAALDPLGPVGGTLGPVGGGLAHPSLSLSRGVSLSRSRSWSPSRK